MTEGGFDERAPDELSRPRPVAMPPAPSSRWTTSSIVLLVVGCCAAGLFLAGLFGVLILLQVITIPDRPEMAVLKMLGIVP